jgi:NADH:ubiquinone oxidoreductase subunit K
MMWAILLLFGKEVLYSTPASAIAGLGQYGAAAVLFVSSLLGVIGYRKSGLIETLLPQQAILMLSAAASLHASALSQYADGIPRPFLFIFADQLPTILAAVLHLVALLYESRESILIKSVKL